MTTLLDRPVYRDRGNVDYLTWAAFLHAEKKARGPELVITQGSYNTSVSASGTTHKRGGALDISTDGMSERRKRRVLKKLRKAGFAAWLRRELWRNGKRIWSEHFHAILIDHPDLSPAAARQVEAYRNRRNGLADNGPDDGPRLRTIPTWRDYMIIITDDNDVNQLAKRLAKITARRVWRHRIPLLGLPAQKVLRKLAKRAGIG